ncbi:MAG: hypothetical protein WEB87_02750 [Bacteriovoracaceae bacterium]
MLKNEMFILLLISIAFSFSICAHQASLEAGQIESNFNYFQLPNKDGNRIKLEETNENLAYRATYKHSLNESSYLYFLVAPLAVTYDVIPNSAFNFDEMSFDAGIPTNVRYRFNSYRVGWFKKGGDGSFQFWGGFVAKIRDAFIEVEQDGKHKKFSNVGLAPLLGFGFLAKPFDVLGLYSHTDALTASQGSAYDSVLKLNVYFGDNHWLGTGKRIVGGGVDNDTLKNFAQFDYHVLDYTFQY